ncbi:MAG TPA: peptidyl-tRNA hydrolase Pth2 [Thermoplasmata archaeon]|nr:peptidyl-tRNA hydrolase Pth2 [Thermoplasmata archaeon]
MGRRDAAPPGIKMVIVLRGELRLTAGKAAVQVAHAAVLLAEEAARRKLRWLEPWRAEGGKKIALVVQTLEELESLRRRAVGRGLPTIVVEDAGLTEVAPGTKTCLGIGPAPSEEIDPVTGGLPLL